MTSPLNRYLLLAAVSGTLLSACGGGSRHPADGSGPATTSTASAPPPVTHADPVNLLPAAGEVRPVIKPASTPTRYDHRLNPSTLGSAFSSAIPRSQRLASGTAELDVVGHNGTFLSVNVFEFKSPAGARSLTSTFLASTRLGTAHGRPSGAPGQLGEASSQPYGKHRGTSYRYAFREGNVLAYVELDGPRGRFSLTDAIRVAAITDRNIKAAVSAA